MAWPRAADLVLGERQRFAGRRQQLPFDEVDAGDQLGDRMLDLQAGVHLEEVRAVASLIHDELDRAGRIVADGAAELERGVVELLRDLVGQVRRRRLLEHLLVVALDRAVALEQMHEVAGPVAGELHLEMARVEDEFLEQDRIVAERGSAPRPSRRPAPAANSFARSTRRMPRPPPPADALISTGKPIRSAACASVA